ncbi:MAG: UDP-3-O-(3-hydroxymyristoyl)glucosamine N-acyltransferase [Deltaproteobacteria bacterium]|nr:UDP-3-O-(3-hydroxymyristoyl)glucosamine N-acyltransferase [Deltaproteobacteria bacterium]
MRCTLAEIATKIGGRVVGDETLEVTGVNSLEAATPEQISFAEEKFLERAQGTRAGALIVPRPAAGLPPNLIICAQPFRAAGLLMREIDREAQALAHLIDERAVIGREVDLGRNLYIGAGAVVCDQVKIGDNCRIYPQTFLGKGVSLGRDCVLYPGVVIRENCRLGDRVMIHPNTVIGSDGFGFLQVGGGNLKIPQIGRVIIEDDVEIGALCTINRAALDETVVGRGTKIDDHVHLGHGVKVGHETIMCAQVGLAGSVRIGNQVMLGPRVGAVNSITIGDRARLMAGTSAARDLPGDQDYGGIPAVPLKQSLRQLMAATHLPKDRGRIATLEQRVMELEKRLREKS